MPLFIHKLKLTKMPSDKDTSLLKTYPLTDADVYLIIYALRKVVRETSQPLHKDAEDLILYIKREQKRIDD